MARTLRLIHIPDRFFGEARLLPVEALGDDSFLRTWALTATKGDSIICFTVVDASNETELDRFANEVRGADADAVAASSAPVINAESR